MDNLHLKMAGITLAMISYTYILHIEQFTTYILIGIPAAITGYLWARVAERKRINKKYE